MFRGRAPLNLRGSQDGRAPQDMSRDTAQTAKSQRARYIVGVHGEVITLADLPPPHLTRWVIRRKAEIVLAVHGGLLTLEEACRRYQLTEEEFAAWKTAIEQHGLLGLRATHVQDYRQGKG